MKILLLGANGAIGTLLMNKALKNGDHIIAYVRRKNAITTTHNNLEIVIGDLKNEELMESLVTKVDVIISALGPHMDMSRKVKSTPISDVHTVILKLMKKHGKTRFITMGTPTIQADNDVKHFSNTLLPWIPRILFPTGYQEYRNIGKILRNSDLDWTVVRFLDPKAKHKNDNYRISLDGKPSKLLISRENIASFIYKVAKEKLYVRQMPLIFH